MEKKTPINKQDNWWRAVEERDAAYDSKFVYGVLSTQVYCRPSCPSRRPSRERVVFFRLPRIAERAGFRACLRCRPGGAPGASTQAEWIAAACRDVVRSSEDPLSLSELAARFGVSPFRFHREFKKATGVTPRNFADACRVRRLKNLLRAGEPVAQSLYEAGYGSSSRLYERANALLGMTPATYRQGGQGMEIHYAVARCGAEHSATASGLGWILVAATHKGVCAVRLGRSRSELERGLLDEFPAAAFKPSEPVLAGWLAEILNHLEGRSPRVDIPIDVKATAFQRRVWEELVKIPYGETRTYLEIARDIGRPKGARAVGRACATNPVAIVVPCHRAVRSDGELAGYRWGLARKKQLLDLERANH